MTEDSSQTSKSSHPNHIRPNLHIGRILAFLSILTFFLTILTFLLESNLSAIFNIMPHWVYFLAFMIPGLMGWIWFHSKWGLTSFALWLLLFFCYSDFFKQLPFSPKPINEQSFPFQFKKLRIVTLAADDPLQIDTEAVKALAPDIILMEVDNNPIAITQTAFFIMGKNMKIKQYNNHAIITRYGNLESSSHGDSPCMTTEWQPEFDGRCIRLVNVITTPRPNQNSFISLGNTHKIFDLQSKHKKEIQRVYQHLAHLNMDQGPCPVILGGNFNTPAHSLIFKPIKEIGQDTYEVAGKGYGATAPASFPLFRFHRIFTSLDFTPLQTFTVDVSGTTERCVVSDVIYQ